MTETKQDSRSMLFVGGLMIGALAAALFTPRNGQQMRKEMKEKAMNMRDKIDNKKDELDNKKDEAANKADDKINDVQTKLQRARDNNSSNK
jgi:gas vesicle protein